MTKEWVRSSLITVTAILVLVIVYHTTIYSMIGVWIKSDTFTHCFFVLPIILWLIWQKREQLLATSPQPSFAFALLLIIQGFAWLIASYVDVQVAQQLAVVSMIPVIVLAILGWESSKIIIFPLMFLFFAVPVGEELVPYLINFTANFAVMTIKFIGVPVYQEGSFIQLPSGNWSVVKTCSGVRYLIASAVLGVLYAYLNYVTFWKRAIFILFSLLIPVIANGMRAAMIILIGHYSDMTLATGIDHVIYGWLFFGLVVIVMFYVGSFFREDTATLATPLVSSPLNLVRTKVVGRKQAAVMVFVVVVISMWPIKYSADNAGYHDVGQMGALHMPEIANWRPVEERVTEWKPSYHNLDAEFTQTYENNGTKVMLYVGYYHLQRQGAELVNYNNTLVYEEDELWRIVKKNTVNVNLETADVGVTQALISSKNTILSVLSLYHVNGKYLNGNITAKLEEAKARLLGGPVYGALIVVVTEANDESNESGFDANKRFLHDAAPTIEDMLKDAYD